LTDERFSKLVYLIHLLNIDGIGPLKIFSLLSKFHNPRDIFHAKLSALVEVDGINKNLSSRILNSTQSISHAKEKLEKTLSSLSKINGRIITYWDEEYPELLKRIYYPPTLLYVIGEFSESDKNSIAIVGTRMPTNYGKQNAEKFAQDLVLNNITVVSGMARGIDSSVHRAALKSNGRTIAVVGSGLDVIYPPENKKLFEEICNTGVVVSEYELGTKPDAQNFPRRNRIISGLCLGSLIVETKINGGAMQTAAYAIDQNREVFAIPGNIDSKQSEGPNALIQRGEAKLVTTAEDILIELNLRIKPEIGKNIPKPSFDLTLFEQNLLNVLDNQQMHIDEIATTSSMSVSDCLVNLLTLEFKGLVKQLPGKMFLKC
jgi:DNA processing protein